MYREGRVNLCYVKRFATPKFILDKESKLFYEYIVKGPAAKGRLFGVWLTPQAKNQRKKRLILHFPGWMVLLPVKKKTNNCHRWGPVSHQHLLRPTQIKSKKI